MIPRTQDRLKHGGETLVELDAQALGLERLEPGTLDAATAELGSTMAAQGADVSVLRRRPDGVVAMARERVGAGPAVEVHVAVIGNVDSGKSTLVGVLTRSALDDGRGLARSRVFTHGHEHQTGVECAGMGVVESGREGGGG